MSTRLSPTGRYPGPGGFGDAIPMRRPGGARRRGWAGFLARLLAGERPEIAGALCVAAIFALAYYAVFGAPGGASSSAYGAINTLSGSVSPVSTFKPAKEIKWQAVQRSCAPSKEGAMTVLVTGSAGFVGFHTSVALKEAGAGVLGLDNVNDYYPVSLKRARLSKLEQMGVMTLEADLNDAHAVRKALDACKFTHVLHLAAQAGVRYAVKNPGSYVHSNVAGMVNLMEEIVHTSPTPKVVFASSSSVYGLNTKVPFREDDATDSPASLYAATKNRTS